MLLLFYFVWLYRIILSFYYEHIMVPVYSRSGHSGQRILSQGLFVAFLSACMHPYPLHKQANHPRHVCNFLIFSRLSELTPALNHCASTHTTKLSKKERKNGRPHPPRPRRPRHQHRLLHRRLERNTHLQPQLDATRQIPQRTDHVHGCPARPHHTVLPIRATGFFRFVRGPATIRAVDGGLDCQFVLDNAVFGAFLSRFVGCWSGVWRGAAAGLSGVGVFEYDYCWGVVGEEAAPKCCQCCQEGWLIKLTTISCIPQLMPEVQWGVMNMTLMLFIALSAFV